jgi:hypothetical protein
VAIESIKNEEEDNMNKASNSMKYYIGSGDIIAWYCPKIIVSDKKILRGTYMIIHQ